MRSTYNEFVSHRCQRQMPVGKRLTLIVHHSTTASAVTGTCRAEVDRWLGEHKEAEVHIPDGYISPVSAVAMYGAAVPFWWNASRVLKRQLAGKTTPVLAVLSAFSFTIMMFNIPVPGGTTAHAVGGTIVAIVVGPWAAVVGISVALIIQAVFFGDGGITAIGANCFNLGIALPFAGYFVYRLIAGKSSIASRRRVIAAALGSYIGLSVGGFLTAVELGIQPIFWSVNGQALYNPYGLEVTVPAMMFAQLTVAGLAELLSTALVVAYLQRAHPELLVPHSGISDVPGEVQAAGQRRVRVTVAIGALIILLTPLGLLASGGAWGEWGPDDLGELVGYAPTGLAQLGGFWSASPLPDYQLPPGSEDASLWDQASIYILSAIVGVALIFVAIFGLRVALAQRAAAADGGPSASAGQH